MKNNIKIIVATHKEYEMPKDKMYLALQVGAEGKDDLGFQKDNEGDNISEKNPYYSELTALYWAWKNLDADYIGLVHYRRHFVSKNKKHKGKESRVNYAITQKEVEKLFQDTDVILPKKRNYYIENLYSHYKHTLYAETLDETRNILEEKYPEYLKEFERLRTRTSAHMFNMFIMKKEILDSYCTWLFDILFELEKRIDPREYEPFHARYLGRVSEYLLDIWINTNNIGYKEAGVLNIEGINWLKKGSAFLMAKFVGRKYEKSF